MQAGHISNIRWMVIGSVGKLGSTMFLNAETIDVQTGQIVKSVNLTEKEMADFVFNINDIVNALNPLTHQPKDQQLTPTDYCLKNDYEKVSVGELAPWGFKLNRFTVPKVVKPGQKITLDTAWLYTKETGYYNPNAVIFVSVYGDWQPDVPIRHLVHGELQGPPRLISKSTEFIAPDKPGVYHIRWSIVWAFAPVKSFYGTDPDGQYNPGIGPWAELEFTVVSG